MSGHDTTVSTPAHGTDLCPPCGVQRPINSLGRFRGHPAANPTDDPDGRCWATDRTRADVELAEALSAGTAWESLEQGP